MAKDEARVAAANTSSEYQSSAEMATLRQTIRDEAFKEAVESFAYTMTTQHSDWDLAYLGYHLAAQIAEWCTEFQVDHPPAEDPPVVLYLQSMRFKKFLLLLLKASLSKSSRATRSQ